MTMNLTVELPDEIHGRLQAEWPSLERCALEGLLVEAYRQKKVSSHEVGQALQFGSRWETLQFLSERGVYPNLDIEDLEEDRRNLDLSLCARSMV